MQRFDGIKRIHACVQAFQGHSAERFQAFDTVSVAGEAFELEAAQGVEGADHVPCAIEFPQIP